MSLSADEVRFLRSADLSQVHYSGDKRSLITEMAQLRAQFGDYARAVAELLDARQSGKLPATWLMDHDSAQQATPPRVAEIRAQRLAAMMPGAVVHDVTCSIGSEAPAVTAAGLSYLGSDLDFPRLLMAQHNVDAPVFRADALRPAARADVVIADPARRQGGRRITDPAKLLPPLPAIVDTYPVAAIKCAPGLDFSQWPGLVSVVSENSAVKEACLYTESLSAGARREAVVLSGPEGPGGGGDRLTDLEPTAETLADAPGKYLIDPDGAIVRAGLVRQFAVREGLWMLDERIAYLTGDVIPRGYSGFEILRSVPVKQIKAALAEFDCGALEILVRGLDVDPDALRKKLKLRGKRQLALVLTRIGAQGRAFICSARQWG